MSTNKHLGRLTIVDKQYKLRQLITKTQKTSQKFSRESNRLKIVSQEQRKAA